MAFGRKHALLTFHGALPGGEDWSIGLRVQYPDMDYGDSELNVLGQPACERFAALRNALASGLGGRTASWGGATSFLGVTARVIATTGVTLLQRELTPVLAQPASASNALLPNQCAVCVTLDTALPGRTRKGRVFLPLLGDVQMDAGRVLQNDEIASAFRNFLADTQNDWIAIDGDFPADGLQTARWVVASRTNGDMNPITRVRVGQVMDTQRRRRSSQVENYAAAAI